MERERYRLRQDGFIVAETDGPSAVHEIKHYAFVYSQDGPVSIEVRRSKKWHRYETPPE